jgi:hypothetical protein
LDETDAFLAKIKNRGFVYLSFKQSSSLEGDSYFNGVKPNCSSIRKKEFNI